MDDSQKAHYVDQAIRDRKTLKVLSDNPQESSLDPKIVEALF